MAVDVRFDHTFDCTLDQYWTKIYFDVEYTRALFLEGLGMRRAVIVSDVTAPDGQRRRQLDVDLAPLELPGPVAKLLKGGLGYRDELVFVPARNETTFSYRFNQLTDRLVMTGRMRVEPTRDGKTRRLTDVHIEGHVFGIGGLVERVMEKITRDTWEKSAVFTREWIVKHPLT